MLQLVDFAKIKKQEEVFSQGHGLEVETLGDHPYIRENFIPEQKSSSQISRVKVLFVKKNFEDEKLNELTEKIIQSFAVNSSDYTVINLEEKQDPQFLNFWENNVAELTVLFESPAGFETLKNGQYKTEFEYLGRKINIAKIWDAKELSVNPELKKSSWALIKHIKTVLN